MTDNTEIDRLLRETLESIPADYRSREGVCHYIGRKYTGEENDWIREKIGHRFGELVTEWPEFSGDDVYPVPCPPWNDITPRYAFHVHSDRNLMWDRDHPYGAARWRLIRWTIAQLNKTEPK